MHEVRSEVYKMDIQRIKDDFIEDITNYVEAVLDCNDIESTYCLGLVHAYCRIFLRRVPICKLWDEVYIDVYRVREANMKN